MRTNLILLSILLMASFPVSANDKQPITQEEVASILKVGMSPEVQRSRSKLIDFEKKNYAPLYKLRLIVETEAEGRSLGKTDNTYKYDELLAMLQSTPGSGDALMTGPVKTQISITSFAYDPATEKAEIKYKSHVEGKMASPPMYNISSMMCRAIFQRDNDNIVRAHAETCLMKTQLPSKQSP